MNTLDHISATAESFYGNHKTYAAEIDEVTANIAELEAQNSTYHLGALATANHSYAVLSFAAERHETTHDYDDNIAQARLHLEANFGSYVELATREMTGQA
jgi:hypothetical protein